MKTRLGALLLGALVILTIAGGGCNGANDVTGVGGSGDRVVNPTPTPVRYPRKPIGGCTTQQHPEDCIP